MIFVYSPCVRLGFSLNWFLLRSPADLAELHVLVEAVHLEANDKQCAKFADFSGGFCDSFHIRVLPCTV